jgi:hypothetical protein
MPIKAVADLFEARLTAEWTETIIVSYDTLAEPPDVDAFLVQQFPVVLGTHPVLGRRFWEDGVYRLVLSVRRGIGTAQGFVWTDELRTLFNNFKFPNGQLETFTPDGPILDDNNEEGDWVIYSLIIPYRYQYDS